MLTLHNILVEKLETQAVEVGELRGEADEDKRAQVEREVRLRVVGGEEKPVAVEEESAPLSGQNKDMQEPTVQSAARSAISAWNERENPFSDRPVQVRAHLCWSVVCAFINLFPRRRRQLDGCATVVRES